MALVQSPLTALDQGQHQLESVPLLLMKSLAEVSIEAQDAMAVIGKLELAPFCDEPVARALDIPVHQVGRLFGELINHGLLVRIKDKYQVSHALVHTFARQKLIVTNQIADRLAAAGDQSAHLTHQ